MIYRKLANGQAMVLTQTDHSRLAGFLASHWGNATFAPLRPYESVTRAATFHDFGWLRYETRPEVDPKTGEPYTFINLPFNPQQLDAYQWCVDWLAASTAIRRCSSACIASGCGSRAMKPSPTRPGATAGSSCRTRSPS